MYVMRFKLYVIKKFDIYTRYYCNDLDANGLQVNFLI